MSGQLILTFGLVTFVATVAGVSLSSLFTLKFR